MGRWSHLDTDEERLPEGMTRVGYDADTQVYTYRDTDGSIWEGAPGVQYGKLFRVHSHQAPPLPSITIPDDVEGDEQHQVLHDYDDDDSPWSSSPVDEKSPTVTSTTKVTAPKQARLRRSHYQQHASKHLPSLPNNNADEKTSPTTETATALDEKDFLHSSSSPSSSTDSIQQEKDANSNPVFSTTHRHRQKRAQERQQKEQQSSLKRSGTLSRIARYLSRAAGGSNANGDSETTVARTMRRRNTSAGGKGRWPGMSLNKAAIMSGEGLGMEVDEEEERERREVEGVDVVRSGRSSRAVSGSSAVSGKGSVKRRGRATTFDEILGSDGRLRHGHGQGGGGF